MSRRTSSSVTSFSSVEYEHVVCNYISIVGEWRTNFVVSIHYNWARMTMGYNIVEGCVVSIRQLHDHRIRREGMMEIANLDSKLVELNVERRIEGRGESTSFPMNWRQQRDTSYSIRRAYLVVTP